MIRKLPVFLASALVLALAPGASAIGVTGQLDSVLADIEARQAEFRDQGDRAGKRSARTIGRAVRILKRRSVGRSLIGEVGGALRAAGLIEARFPDEAGILGGFAAASGIYEQEVLLGALVLEAQTQQQGLRRARLRALQRRLARAQAGLAAAAEAETVRARLAAQLRVARATRGAVLTGDDFVWVVASLSIAGTGESFGDNALADAAGVLADEGVDLDTLLGSSVFSNPEVLLLDFWAVDDFAADPLVFTGLLNGIDNDGNTSDNFTGNETFIGGLDLDGHAAVRATTTLQGGAYDVELEAGDVRIGAFGLETGDTVRVAGTASESANSGRIGLAVRPDDLLQLATNSGAELSPDVLDALLALADVDTDGDQEPDALSATLSFSCTRANVTRP